MAMRSRQIVIQTSQGMQRPMLLGLLCARLNASISRFNAQASHLAKGCTAVIQSGRERKASPAFLEVNMAQELELLLRMFIAAVWGSLIGADCERLVWAAGLLHISRFVLAQDSS